MKRCEISLGRLVYWGSLAFVILIFLILTSFNIIGYGVQERCRIAQDRYQGDCVESLMTYLQDERNDFRSRNSAIWALGQLGDLRALELLKSYYQEVPDGREPLDKMISQYELSKAIKLTEGGINLTAFFWR